MGDRPTQRRLAAVLAADVAGYTRLMELDTDGTVAAWQAARKEVIKPTVADHSGKIVKLTGDGFLVEFSTVQDAVNCAIAMQRGLASSSLDFRMGVNLGDIVDDGEDIHGEGVNVAARLEGLADPEGICISGDVYNQVRNRVDAIFEDMGQQEVKNVSAPVQVYAVRLESSAAPSASGAPAISDKPSIAVLPFDNMSADSEQDYFADGISEDIITALSKISGLFVISRNSTFAYKGKSFDIRKVCRDLGVRYVLEGSVRRAGDKVRITAQLIDAGGGDHVWAARFDRDLTDIFALQDEITSNVVEALHVQLVEGEQARVWCKSTECLAAWECLTQGLTRFRRYTREANIKARALFEKSVELDAEYAAAWVWLGWTYWAEVRFLWADSRDDALERAGEMAQKALTLDEAMSEAHALSGSIHLVNREFEQAIAEGEKAVALDPNGADVTALLAMILNWSGRPEEAGALIDKAMQLSPRYSAWYLSVLAHAYHLMARHDEAIATYKDSISRNPDHLGTRIGLTSCYAECGHAQEAAAQAAEILRINPTFTIEQYANSLTYRDPAHSKRSLDALRSAGLPE